MRRFLREYCWCLFGRQAAPANIGALIDREGASNGQEFDSYEKEQMGPNVDSSNWNVRSIENLTPYRIKDSDLTKEYATQENQTKDQKLRDIGYELGVDIGMGGFGRVRIAYRVNTNGEVDKMPGKECACKIILLDRQITRTDAKEPKSRMANFKNELFILVKSVHNNIVKIKDHFILNDECYLMMEYANGGNLRTDIKKMGPYPENEAMAYFAQISSAIYYLHCKLGIAHSDLKPANFLIFEAPDSDRNKRVIKVTDFGLSRLRFDKVNKEVMKETSPRGTLPFMSPQVLTLYVTDRIDQEVVSSKITHFNPFIADIWSLGVCLYSMIFREFPFPCEDDPRLMRYILEAQIHKRYTFPPDISKKLSIGCTDIMEDCLEPNPHKRLTIQNIVCHYWFEDHFSIEELCGSAL